MNSENVEVSSQEMLGAEEDLVELGCASKETRGLFFGVTAEISIIPWRLI